MRKKAREGNGERNGEDRKEMENWQDKEKKKTIILFKIKYKLRTDIGRTPEALISIHFEKLCKAPINTH